MTRYGWQTFWGRSIRTFWQKVRRLITRPRRGKCAQCGQLTNRYDYRYDWFICEKHSSDDVAMDLLEHVMDPNGEEDWTWLRETSNKPSVQS